MNRFNDKEIVEMYKGGMSYRDIEKLGVQCKKIRSLVKGTRTNKEASKLMRERGKGVLTDDGRKKLSEIGKRACIRSGKFWTKPELEFKKILNSIGIGVRFPSYVKEVKNVEDDPNEKFVCYQYPIQRYVVDFVDVNNKTAINVNGDYWHANPLLYNKDNLGKMQKVNVRQDGNKKIFLEKNGWKIIDIWESEIYWNKNAVINKIINVGDCDKSKNDWSESIKSLWFKEKKIRKPVIKNIEKIKKVCENILCKKEFEVIKCQKTRRYCCLECACMKKRKTERPSREELEKLIKNESFKALGRKYGVSDNAVRKWAKIYGLL